MKELLLFVLPVLFTQCTHRTNDEAVTHNNIVVPQKNILNYDSCKKSIDAVKKDHAKDWQQLSKVDKEQIFTYNITHSIIPNWIGTAWSFNGVSQIPQKGSIACGYFVTTVLRDGGVDLARIKLAQCASEQMISTLVQPKYIKRFSNLPIENFIESINLQGAGLYIVGLDNHTGFIHNDGKEIYFIHSTFVGTRNVQKEIAQNSIVLKSSKYKVLGKISADERVLNNWIN